MSNYGIKCKIIEEELKTFWPQWHVEKRLGGGSFGDVYKIFRDNYGIRQISALKIIQDIDKTAPIFLQSDASEGKESIIDNNRVSIPEVFRNEIQIMEALRGAPNIVSIDDFYFKHDELSSSLFVRMEYLTSFQEIIMARNRKQVGFSIEEILKIGRDVCNALIYCEQKGIIHRDIKPSNLFIDEFRNYKVGDFGVSKRMETVHIAHEMTSIGTISYMAPEIFQGRSYNNTVDIYALGLILYQLLNNGRIPFLPISEAYTPQDIDSANYQRLHGKPIPSLAGIRIGETYVDERLDAIVQKACAIDSADRYQTAKDFYNALSFESNYTQRLNPNILNRTEDNNFVINNRIPSEINSNQSFADGIGCNDTPFFHDEQKTDLQTERIPLGTYDSSSYSSSISKSQSSLEQQSMISEKKRRTGRRNSVVKNVIGRSHREASYANLKSSNNKSVSLDIRPAVRKAFYCAVVFLMIGACIFFLKDSLFVNEVHTNDTNIVGQNDGITAFDDKIRNSDEENATHTNDTNVIRQKGVITASDVIIRSSGEEKDDNIIGTLMEGDEVFVGKTTIDSKGITWVFITLANGNEGYVKAQWVQMIEYDDINE